MKKSSTKIFREKPRGLSTLPHKQKKKKKSSYLLFFLYESCGKFYDISDSQFKMSLFMELSPSYFFDLSLFTHRSLFEDISFPWEALKKLSAYLNAQTLGIQKGSISPSAYFIHPELISIGEGSIIEPGAFIQGPCIIGKQCVVRHGAYIRGNVITGDHCVIGHDSEVKHAIFLDRAHAAHFAYVGDSILGNGVNLGAGVKCANFRLDQGNIQLRLETQQMATGLRKLGAIIGDGAQIGCNTVTNPGTLIGQAVRCYPCLNIEGFIPSHSLIKPSTKPSIHSML